MRCVRTQRRRPSSCKLFGHHLTVKRCHCHVHFVSMSMIRPAIAGRLLLSLLTSLSLSEGSSWPRWSRSWVAGLSEEARDTQGAGLNAGHKICLSYTTGSANELCGSVVLSAPLSTSPFFDLDSVESPLDLSITRLTQESVPAGLTSLPYVSTLLP